VLTGLGHEQHVVGHGHARLVLRPASAAEYAANERQPVMQEGRKWRSGVKIAASHTGASVVPAEKSLPQPLAVIGLRVVGALPLGSGSFDCRAALLAGLLLRGSRVVAGA
jgi:hypothetical protein